MFVRVMMPYRKILLLLLCFLLPACSVILVAAAGSEVQVDQSDKFKQMDEKAANLYRYTKEQRYEDALMELEGIKDLMTEVNYKGVTSLEGLNALTSLVTEASQQFHQLKPNHDQFLLAAAKIRLAADALSHKEKPMWLEYRSLFTASAKQIKSAIRDKNPSKAIEALQQFHKHYLIIKPAVHISRDPSLIVKLDSWFIFMKGLLSQSKFDYAKAQAGIAHTDELIRELFQSGEQVTTVPPLSNQQPYIWAALLATVIITVLVYVGYQKYKHDPSV